MNILSLLKKAFEQAEVPVKDSEIHKDCDSCGGTGLDVGWGHCFDCGGKGFADKTSHELWLEKFKK